MKLNVSQSSVGSGKAAIPRQRSARAVVGAGKDRLILRMGAVAGLAGLLLRFVTDMLHPSKAPPNDSAAAFREYAGSSIWTYVHIAQYLCALLIVMSLLALARRLARQENLAGALALVGGVMAVMVAVVFTVQMAVDGVALRSAVHAWVSAPPGPATVSAFGVAEAVRSLEKGLSAFFLLNDGFTLLALGLAIALGRRYARWLGWTGAVAGVAFLVGGVVTAGTGFSPEAGLFLTPASILLAVFLVGVCVSMWRDDASVALQ
ncbi:MAG TPA: hypothetical protein VK204_06225 [Nocardioidaceae bacterium]|nr:hypothetical protein [Nocardioidaceae bacterium]